MRTFDCPTFFYFHVGNAYESADGSCLHVDLAAYDDPQILHDLSLQPLTSPRVDQAGELQQQVSRAHYKRLTIPLTGTDGAGIEVRTLVVWCLYATQVMSSAWGNVTEPPAVCECSDDG